MYGIALEKGYAVLKCDNNNIESGYKNIIGGFPYQAFETILGAKCEKYFSNNYIYDEADLKNHDYKYIEENNLKKKIKKYIDLGGIIAFGVFFNLIEGGHAYSLINYKIDKYGNMFIEIINPNRCGDYAEENIYFNGDINKKKLKDSIKNFPIIYEKDFINKDCIQSLYSYKSTGYLIMEFKTFFKWYNCIDMCDPMIGYYEQIIEFIPDGKNYYNFNFIMNKKDKFRAYIFIKNDINNNINNYNLIIKNKENDIIFNDDTEYNNKIFYGLLEEDYYSIIIKSRHEEEIEDVIYLKIYSPKQLAKNNKNNVINLRNKFFEICPQYKFVKSFIPKFYIFLKNNNNDLFMIPNNKSLYDIAINYEKYFYYYIIYTTFGYYVNVIFKYKWKYVYKIKYRYNQINYNIITTKGNFKSTTECEFFDFSDDFKKNIFENNEVKEPILWSDTFIDNNNKPLEKIIDNNFDNLIYKEPDFINEIDIIYLIDSTGSMGDELKNATKLSINNSNYLYKYYPNIDFKFGFIYYNDPIDIETDSNDYLQLTKDFNKICKFFDNRKNQCGGDAAEDWAGGYDIALKKIKWRKGKRWIIHICDAPAHGELFSKNSYDDHKEKKYEDDLINNIKECADKNIEIIGVYKGEDAKNCFLECKKIYDENNGKTFIIQEYNPSNLLILTSNFNFNN